MVYFIVTQSQSSFERAREHRGFNYFFVSTSLYSPTWHNQSPAVPTWNYAAVHSYDKVSLLDAAETFTIVQEVIEQYEPELLIKRDIVTDKLRDPLLSAVVGFKVELSKIEGKLKLGQHRKKSDQIGVYHAPKNAPDLKRQCLTEFMDIHSIGNGSLSDN